MAPAMTTSAAPATTSVSFVRIGDSPLRDDCSLAFVEHVRRWNLALHAHGHGLAIPCADQRLLAQVSVEQLLHHLDAAVVHQLRVGLEATVERHRDLPGPREHVRILEGSPV